jgi:hypothetical protein
MTEAEPLIAVRDLVQKIGQQEILRGLARAVVARASFFAT